MIIVIEGGDQAGKLTQSILLEQALKNKKSKPNYFIFLTTKPPLAKKFENTWMEKKIPSTSNSLSFGS